MKRKLLIILLFFGLTGLSQEFEVTTAGLKDKANLENEFLVIKVPDTNVNELYQNAIKYVNETFKSPDDALKGKTENEYLRFVTYAPQFLKVNNSGVKLDVSAEYTTELRFKEGKVRYEIIELNMTADNGGRNVYFKGSKFKGYPIYDKNDKLRLPDTKNDLEDYFNSRINGLSSFLTGRETDKDDW